MRALMSSISVLKPVSGTFYRGIAAKTEDCAESYVKGKHSHWTAWSSMSKSIRRAFDFARGESARQFGGDEWHIALFVVECCEVYDFSKLSHYPDEEELVLQPNTDLEVIHFMEKTKSLTHRKTLQWIFLRAVTGSLTGR